MDGSTAEVKKVTNLWRNRPVAAKSAPSTIKIHCVEASARMAITKLLAENGLGRDSFVAIPRFSSHCVIHAVSKAATPVPIDFVGAKKIDAVLLYEQWGWPLQLGKGDVKGLKARLMILDKVDSADIKRRSALEGSEIFSLSKILGLPGGALVRREHRFIKANHNQSHKNLAAKLGHDDTLMDLYKNEVDWPHPKLEKWLKKNSLSEALDQELKKRQENLAALLDSELVKGWPEWMMREARNKIGPGLAPLFRDRSIKDLIEISDMLAKDFGLETRVYHFDWSGNPLGADYGNCLAIPLHGQVENFGEMIRMLEKTHSTKKNSNVHDSGRR